MSEGVIRIAMSKRTVAVTVRITEEDQEQFHQCAQQIWPGAVLSESGIVLGLARLGCKAEMDKRKKGGQRPDKPRV